MSESSFSQRDREIDKIERELIRKFPKMEGAKRPFVHHDGYVYFTLYFETRPNDYRYEHDWITYRTKSDGSGEPELFGKTHKETDPGGVRVMNKEGYQPSSVVKAIMGRYGKNIFWDE